MNVYLLSVIDVQCPHETWQSVGGYLKVLCSPVNYCRVFLKMLTLRQVKDRQVTAVPQQSETACAAAGTSDVLMDDDSADIERSLLVESFKMLEPFFTVFIVFVYGYLFNIYDALN